jgi:hypothetical protein
MQSDPRHRTRSTQELVRQAIHEARELAGLEIALAKTEMRQELTEAKKAGITLGVAGALAICGVSLLLVSIALAFSATWLPALLVGVITLACAGVIGLLGYQAAPKEALGETRRSARTDFRALKEHNA